MKFLFRSTNNPPGLLGIAVLGVGLPDTKFLSHLNAALKASGLAPKVLITAATMPAANVHRHRHRLTLLMGCENASLELEASDAAIRRVLAESSTAYQVLYGDLNERLSQALTLIEAELMQTSSQHPSSAEEQNSTSRAWVWMCDKCSDPQCEHRLLTDLLANRPPMAAVQATED